MQRIAYLGPAGTFSEMALVQLLERRQLPIPDTGEPEVIPVPAPSQAAALEMVRDGRAAGAVVPIESSVEGSIAITLDALASGTRLQIIAETELDITFSIAAQTPRTPAEIRTVAAYPIAVAQVREWLARELPNAQVLPATSNSDAAVAVIDGHADAAVTTALAARQLHLHSLAAGVADFAGAVTRFVLVTPPRVAPERTGSDRTSMVLTLANEPGSLTRAFNEFAVRGIDLSRIESRPTRTGMGTYRFYLDCIGHIDDTAVAEALKALHRSASVRYLGSWPTAVPGGTAPPDDAAAVGWLQRIRKGEIAP